MLMQKSTPLRAIGDFEAATKGELDSTSNNSSSTRRSDSRSASSTEVVRPVIARECPYLL